MNIDDDQFKYLKEHAERMSKLAGADYLKDIKASLPTYTWSNSAINYMDKIKEMLQPVGYRITLEDLKLPNSLIDKTAITAMKQANFDPYDNLGAAALMQKQIAESFGEFKKPLYNPFDTLNANTKSTLYKTIHSTNYAAEMTANFGGPNFRSLAERFSNPKLADVLNSSRSFLAQIQQVAKSDLYASVQMNRISNSLGLYTNHPSQQQIDNRFKVLPSEFVDPIFDSVENETSESIDTNQAKKTLNAKIRDINVDYVRNGSKKILSVGVYSIDYVKNRYQNLSSTKKKAVDILAGYLVDVFISQITGITGNFFIFSILLIILFGSND